MVKENLELFACLEWVVDLVVMVEWMFDFIGLRDCVGD